MRVWWGGEGADLGPGLKLAGLQTAQLFVC